MVSKAWMTVLNTSILCYEFWSTISSSLMAFCAAQLIQGLLDKRSSPASRIRALGYERSQWSLTEDMILHLASVMLFDDMGLPASASTAYRDALAKECRRGTAYKGISEVQVEV
jgi:hypothetical protein